MELIRGSHNIRLRHRRCVATIGNYDGVHLGHQKVIESLRMQAGSLPVTVITFEPTPQEVFAPDKAPARLTRLREKAHALAGCGVDRLLVLRFDRKLAAMEPETFIDRLLVDGLGVERLVVGDDFRFGHRRRGDFSMLAAAGRRHGFTVATMPTFEVEGERVSSTRVRRALRDGDLALAQRLLGRAYRMMGRVVQGRRLGRQIGFPTANIRLQRTKSPLHGIFAVRVHGLDGGAQRAVASVGTRPTVDGRDWLLEVHLLDGDRDLYGRHLSVEFVRHLRPEKRFESVAEMAEQIARDADAARQCLTTVS